MSVDATKVVHVCPLCQGEFPSREKTLRHISEKTGEAHKGVDGFNMDKTVVTKEKDLWDIDTEQELHNKIAQAAEYFDELDRESINKIADEAEVHYSRVCRVFEDEGIDYTMKGRHPPKCFDDLTRRQKVILESANLESDDVDVDIIRSKVESKLNLEKPLRTRSILRTINRYSWVMLPIYDGGESESKRNYDGEITIEGDIQENYDEVCSNIGQQTSEVTTEMLEKDDSQTINKIRALEDAGVEFSIECEEDDFEVIKKLIQAGHDELAEEMFDS